MSDDLIRRSDAIGAITNHCENKCYYRVDNWCPQCQREDFEEAIKAVPSADRPQGEWIDKGWKGDWQFETDGRGTCWRVFECSVCNGWNTRKTRFCPHCGAKMKGADDEL